MRNVSVAIVLLVVAAALALLFGRSRDEQPGDADRAAEAPAPELESAAAGTRATADGSEAARREIPPAPTARRIAGRVVGPGGRAIGAAEVVLARVIAPWPADEVDEIDRVLTASDGRFQFGVTGDVADAELVVEAAAPGFARQRVAAPRALARVEVRLEPGFVVQGVVVGPDHSRGASNVTVALEPGPWSARKALTTVTDSDGRFRFDDVPAGATGIARITARMPPLSPASVASFPIGSSEPLRIQMPSQPAAFLAGHVTRAGTGKAIGGSLVRVYPSIGWNGRLHAPFEAVTDADGRYEIRGLSLGSAFVVVSHPEHSSSSRVITLGPRPVHDFELVRRAGLELRLTGDAPEGLRLAIASAGNESSRTRVGAGGVVCFDGTFSVGPATLEVLGGERVFAKSSARMLSVTVEDAETTALELELLPASRLRGRVVDQDGAPLEGVTVSTPRYRYQPRNPERWYAQTDADGTFELLGLPVGSAMLQIDHPDFAPIEVEAETPGPGATRELPEVRLERPGTVRGTVTHGGKPLAGAVVLVGRDRGGAVSAVSGADGGYELRVTPGKYRILARFGSLPIQVSEQVVEVQGGAVVEDVDLAFPQGRRLRGMVVNTTFGLPVPDAFVFVPSTLGAVSTTDQHGHFEMDVPEGSFDLQVFSPNFQIQESEEVGHESEFVTVRLPWIAHGTLTGTVVGLPGARPLSEVFLRVEPLDAKPDWDENERRQRRIPSVAVPLVAGRLTFDRMPAGHSRVEITAPGYVPFQTDVEVRADQRTDLETVSLEPGAALRGVVRDVEGQPVAGAFVHIGQEEDLRFDLARRTMTDARGEFTIIGVAPNARRLIVAADGYAAATAELRIPEDLLRQDPLPVVVRRASTVEVQIVEENGRPAQQLQVVSVEFEGELIEIRGTDTDGHAEFTAYRPGTYRFALFGREAQTGVEVEVGTDPQEHEVRLETR